MFGDIHSPFCFSSMARAVFITPNDDQRKGMKIEFPTLFI